MMLWFVISRQRGKAFISHFLGSVSFPLRPHYLQVYIPILVLLPIRICDAVRLVY